MNSEQRDAPTSTLPGNTTAGESAPTLTTGLSPIRPESERSPGHMMPRANDNREEPTPDADVRDADDIGAQDCGVPLGKWNDTVRRARFGRSQLAKEHKRAALTFGTYADADGTNIHCGTVRFALDLEVSLATARRHIAWLRDVGLIELVRSGNRRARRADEYRLTVGPVVAKSLEIPDAGEYRLLVEGQKECGREAQKVRRLGDQRSSSVSANAVGADGPVSAHSYVSADSAISAHSRTDQRSRMSERPPSTLLTYPVSAPPTGGTLPPDPLRPHSPSARGTDQQNPITDQLTPAQDQQGESLPRVCEPALRLVDEGSEISREVESDPAPITTAPALLTTQAPSSRAESIAAARQAAERSQRPGARTRKAG